VTGLDFLYLKRSWTFTDQLGLAGRTLAHHFQSEVGEGRFRIAHVVVEGPAPVDERFAEDVLTVDDVESSPPDVIYIEGGLVSGVRGETHPRVPAGLMDRLLRRGTIVLVADLDINRAEAAADELGTSFRYFGAKPRTGSGGLAYYGIDKVTFVEHERRILAFPENMSVSDWLRPTFEGVERLEVSNAAVLEVFDASILATGNASTSDVLHLDRFVDRGFPFVFATVRQHYLGFAVLIAGNFSHDLLVESTPDNARWLTNVVRHLQDRVSRDRALATRPSVGEVAEGERRATVSDLLEAGESDQLEFKSTCWYDLRLKQASENRETDVLRAIAGLANARGGTLLIGVDDTGQVLGIGPDLKIVQPKNWDGFQQRLAARLEKRLALVGARAPAVSRETVSETVVCRIDVSAARQPVWLDGEELPVRSPAQTRRLRGEAAYGYIRDHFHT
jgi:hypothetical protein